MSPAQRFLGFAAAGSLAGLTALALGVMEGSLALAGLGLITLLQVPLALVVRHRILGGLGNQGLDAERRALRGVGHLMTLLGLALLALGLTGLAGRPGPDPGLLRVLIPIAVLASVPLAGGKAEPGEEIPTLAQARIRAHRLALAAGLSLAGGLLGHLVPWADAAAGLSLALGAVLEGRRLRAVVAVKAACGGCGSCSCG